MEMTDVSQLAVNAATGKERRPTVVSWNVNLSSESVIRWWRCPGVAFARPCFDP